MIIKILVSAPKQNTAMDNKYSALIGYILIRALPSLSQDHMIRDDTYLCQYQ